ncbi:RagB/SusD family nutrient uptake outer membrane protein [uncultured Draconibacterium sp.]|uniref:RagB/SusD family nutrient uptake outer membrane protein n=1 Tax=uncultured Draconibacterium sp. TaxID=1573823 RepID=UPI003261C1C1
MKTNIINRLTSIAIVLLLLVQVGCESAFEDALDRADDSRETLEGMLDDPDKIWGMLNSAYSGIPKDRAEIYFWTTFESLTDNCFEAQGQSMGNWRSGLLSPSFAAVAASRETGNQFTMWHVGWWGRYWGAIRHCNTIIDNIDNITASQEALPQADRDQILDEAIILRAYFHWMLISMYGPLPFMDENLPIDFADWKEMTRPTYDEVANRIASDLQMVIDRGNVPMKRDPFNTNDKYRVPLSFAYGLKSRVLLYNASPLNNPSGDEAKYAAAAAAAKQFIDLGIYSLEPFENSKERLYNSPMAENVEETEVIWRGRDKFAQLCNVAGMNLAATNPKYSTYGNFKAGETPSQEIVDCYELKDGSLIIENYDATHASPTFTANALAAGYDDENDPYGMHGGPKRDDRFYRDIMFNGNTLGESYQMGTIQVWTYSGAPGTGTNGNVTSGNNKQTYTGYYYGKDRNPLWYGKGTPGEGNARTNQHAVLMRYAEIYLNYAEALCGAGQLDAACNALDMTRLRANQPSIKAVPGFQQNKEWLMKRIYNERRIELVLEDHRFYDVRRWDLISNQNNNTISGMNIEKVGENQFKYTRYQTPFVWECHNEKYKVLPIPLDDKKLLPNMDQPEAWQ